ncbi:hypothetical protein M0R45_011039 [Rubus argutus]|uniref:Uncharacterized protein n=1 Tax=Rubus argutus TaxID=59490 RepID=A0AAW1Y8P7_RUBAR
MHRFFCHLPLHIALPVHMSAILQSVNRLRVFTEHQVGFSFRNPLGSDISNRARVLLSRWSKSLARSQAMKKPNGMKTSSDSQELALLKRSIDEAKVIIHGIQIVMFHILSLPFESADNLRKSEASEPMKLLTASSDDSNKKHILGVSSSEPEFRGRRKFNWWGGTAQDKKNIWEEFTGCKSNTCQSGSSDVCLMISKKQNCGAQYMQSKYGKSGNSSENKEVRAEGVNKLPVPQASILPLVPNVPVRV